MSFAFEMLPVLIQRNFSGLFRTIKESTKSRSLENKMRLSFSQTPRISESVERFLFARELVWITSKPNPERTSKSLTDNWASSKTLKGLLSVCFCNQTTSQRTEGRPICHPQLSLDSQPEFQGVSCQMRAVLGSFLLDTAFPGYMVFHGKWRNQSWFCPEVKT